MRPLNFILSPEQEQLRRKKISKTMKLKGINPNARNPNPGKFKRTKETLLKMRLSHLGQKGWNKGKLAPWVTERNLVNNPSKIGEDHWNWQGGITSTNRKIRSSKEWREWRQKVFKRDNFTCQECRSIGIELHPHHIVSLTVNKDLIFDINNGLTLCIGCHIYSKKYHKNIKKVS